MDMTADGRLSRSRSQNLRPLPKDWPFVLALSLLFVARFLIMRHTGAPATTDAGNWLAFSNSLLGTGFRSPEIVYPPVVPILTRGGVEVFGLVDGIAVVGALTSLLPGIGVYWVLRRLGMAPWHAFGPGLLVAAATSMSEALAWGGFPQLISLGLLTGFLLAFDRFLAGGTVRQALAAGLLLALLVGTSHFILTGAVGGMFVLGLLNIRALRESWRRVLLRLPLVIGFSVVFLPIYLQLAASAFGVSSQFRELNQLSSDTLLPSVEFLFRDLPWLWRPLFVLALVAPLVLTRQRDALWRLTVATGLGSLVPLLMLGEPRYLYILPIAGGLALGLAIRAVLRRPGGHSRRKVSIDWLARLVTVGLIVLALLQGIVGTTYFVVQHRFYAVVTPGVFAGIEHAAERSKDLGLIALPSLNDAPLGWWVEGVLQKSVVYGSPLRWLTFEDEIERATLANEIFAPGFPTAERYRLALTNGIDSLFIPKRWGFFDSARVPSGQDRAVLFENDEVVIVDVAQALEGCEAEGAGCGDQAAGDSATT